ncbi:unnamed protein product [Blepharisma stoltei]|uniref:Uncharacterized protein n=1 Tax=Blepharisma stoltei TaxID=1481888 RepID=A0AAU9KC61_9CILI|nr:unnamed protein product [Blepharisma stoltei]
MSVKIFMKSTESSDIENILESQTWKKASKSTKAWSTLSYHNEPKKAPISLLPKISSRQSNRNNTDLSLMNNPFIDLNQITANIKLIEKLSSKKPKETEISDLNKSIRVPAFPKKPFGMHTQSLNSSLLFTEVKKKHIINTSLIEDDIKLIKSIHGRHVSCKNNKIEIFGPKVQLNKIRRSATTVSIPNFSSEKWVKKRTLNFTYNYDGK